MGIWGRRLFTILVLWGSLSSTGCLGSWTNTLLGNGVPTSMQNAGMMQPTPTQFATSAPMSVPVTAPNNIQRASYQEPAQILPQQMPVGQPVMNGQPVVGAPVVQGQPVMQGAPVMNGGMVTTCGPNGCGASGGCSPGGCPIELQMTSHPPYTVGPPDILFITGHRLVPRGPYRLEALEIVHLEVIGALPNQQIKGDVMISPEGTINLGYDYGTVRVGGLTLEQARQSIRNHLLNVVNNPTVNLTLLQFRGAQQVLGEHLVRQDGTISLGTYGSVYVAGMTLGQIKCEVERYLSAYLLNPLVSVDVFSYNSKRYYIIVDGAGFGQQVFHFPITGNETVLDAIAQIQGLAPMSSKRRIVLARPAPCNNGCSQVLPIDWEAITQGGVTCTNYQLFPGDRIYLGPDRLIWGDNVLSKLLAPIERIMGVTLLGTNVVSSLSGRGGVNNGGGFFVTTR